MAIEISEKIRLYGKEALEERLNVATIAGRNAIPLNERYNGMITTVREEGKRYELLYKGDFEALSQAAKDSFLGDNDNWGEASTGYALTDKDKAIDIEDLGFTSWDQVVDSGLYMGHEKDDAPPFVTFYGWHYVQVIKRDEDNLLQIGYDDNGSYMWARVKSDGSWTDWVRPMYEGDKIVIKTNGWGKGERLVFKAYIDDDIGIQEWEMARIYATPHNDGYYQGEVSPMSYVAKTHRFLKDDTEGSEVKGDIEAGTLQVESIKGDAPLDLLKTNQEGPGERARGMRAGSLLITTQISYEEFLERIPQYGIYASGAIRSPFIVGDHSVTIGSTDGHGGFGRPQLMFRELHTVGNFDACIALTQGSFSPGNGELTYSANGGHKFEGKIICNEDIEAGEGTLKIKNIEFPSPAEGINFIKGSAFGFGNTSGSGQRINVGALLVSNNFGEGSVPTNGILSKGNIVTEGDVTAYSDRRLKANIKPIAKALDKIKKIEGVSYTRIDQSDKRKKHIGVIAQDLLKVVPEVVSVPDKPEDMHSVDYSKLTALLIEGIKEQQQQIDQLKHEVQALKGGSNGTS